MFVDFITSFSSPSLPAMFTNPDFVTILRAMFLWIEMSPSAPVSMVVMLRVDVSAVGSAFISVFISAMMSVFGFAYFFVAAVRCCNYCYCNKQANNCETSHFYFTENYLS